MLDWNAHTVTWQCQCGDVLVFPVDLVITAGSHGDLDVRIHLDEPTIEDIIRVHHWATDCIPECDGVPLLIPIE